MLKPNYIPILRGLVRDIGGVVPAETALVCGVIPRGSDRVIVLIAVSGDLENRYAVELPLCTESHEFVNHMAILQTLRRVEVARRASGDSYQRASTTRRCHGAPIIVGDSFLLGELEEPGPIWADDLRTVLTPLVQPGFFVNDVPELSVIGFTQHQPDRFRIYVTSGIFPNPIALDVPRRPSAGIDSELAALFRTGVPSQIAACEVESDDYSVRRYDLHRWYGCSDTAS